MASGMIALVAALVCQAAAHGLAPTALRPAAPQFSIPSLGWGDAAAEEHADKMEQQAHAQTGMAAGTELGIATQMGVAAATRTHDLLSPPYSWMVRLGTDVAEVNHPGLKNVEDVPELVNLATGYFSGSPDAMKYAELIRAEKASPFDAPGASDLPNGMHINVRPPKAEEIQKVDPMVAFRHGDVLATLEGVVAGDGHDPVSRVAKPAVKVAMGEENVTDFAKEVVQPVAEGVFGRDSRLTLAASPLVDVVTGGGDMMFKGRRVASDLAEPIAEEVFGRDSKFTHAARPAMDILVSDKGDMVSKAKSMTELAIPVAEAALGEKNPMSRLVHPVYDAAVNGKLDQAFVAELAQQYGPQMVDPMVDMVLGKDNQMGFMAKPMMKQVVGQMMAAGAAGSKPAEAAPKKEHKEHKEHKDHHKK